MNNQLLMLAEFMEMIVAKTKTCTVREGHRYDLNLGPCIIIAINQDHDPILVTITKITHATVNDLSGGIAQSDGFSNINALVNALSDIYVTKLKRVHEITKDHPITIVKFIMM